MAAAESLGYRRHPLSTALRTGRTNIIGLSLGDAPAFLRHPHSALMVSTVQQALAQRGYAMLVVTLGGVVPCDLRLMDGVIVMGYQPGEENAVESAALRMPLLHWFGVSEAQQPGISYDGEALNTRIAQVNHELAARHLFALGHRSIALVEPWGARNNYPGLPVFQRIAQDAGIQAELTGIYDYLTPRTYPNAMRFLDGLRLPTAIYALDDEVAQRIIDKLSWRGLAVPRDVSVFSRQTDDADFEHGPGMTGVFTDWPSSWSSVVDQYLDMLEGKLPTGVLRPVVPSQRVVERTTCAPRATTASPQAKE